MGSFPSERARPGVELVHPNRDTPETNLARLSTVICLLASAAVLTIIALGGWDKLVGAKMIQVVFIIIYVAFAYFVHRWNRGVLPVAAALAVILAIFAVVAGPGWFDRDSAGYAETALPASLLGILTLVLIPLQMLLVFVSMWGFSQFWNVEEEAYDHDAQVPAPSVTPATGNLPA